MTDPALRSQPRDRGRWIGDYELFERLGAGGMAEVYRARDDRLGREVALKVLPEDFSLGSARARRFMQEARTASALNHPNIVTVYDVGAQGPAAYIAMELVVGRTLREVLASGPLAVAKLLDVAAQMASGLARAHEAGLAHRDLKPENVMVSREGLVKILDFGLAKWLPFESGAATDDDTMTLDTDAGVLLGTVGYMSPEQAAGAALDVRTDQFSFGAILYEMATGMRAFERATKPETMAAIIRDDPEPIAVLAPRLPPTLCWIVERCLRKTPDERYAATVDLARDLADLRDRLPRLEARASDRDLRATRSRRRGAGVIVSLLLAAAAGTAFWLGGRVESTRDELPRWEKITFRHEGISNARFAPDGENVIYAAAREGAPQSLFAARAESPEVRALGLERASILAVSKSAELAVLLDPGHGRLQRPPHGTLATERDPQLLYGTLARVPLAGGAPRELLDDVREADWAPNGEDLAVVHLVDGNDRLEYPIGNVLHQSSAWLFQPRVSPDGALVAFTASEKLLVAELDGRLRTLANNVWELAWSPFATEIWYGRVSRETTEIHAVTLDGRDRLIVTLPGDFVLEDISRDGRVLLGQVFESSEIFGIFPGDSRERNLSWLDRSAALAVSADGGTLMFADRPTTSDTGGALYLRGTSGGPAKRLGEGAGAALSPDGRYVLILTPTPNLLPTGPGPSVPLRLDPVAPRNRGDFFPDGKRIFFMGQESGHGVRGYVAEIAGGEPRAITPEGTRRGLLSGDGRHVTARAADGGWYLYPTAAEGEARRVAGLERGEEPIMWSSDGTMLYIRGADEIEPGETSLTLKLYRLDPWSGERRPWLELPAVNPTIGGEIGRILSARGGDVCIYNHHRYSTDLFAVDGWR